MPIVEKTSSDGEDVRVTQIEDKEARVDSEVDLKILAESIRDAVAELPHAQRTVFELRKYQGLSYQEVAGVMRCPVGTVKSRMSRAERALRPKLKEIKDELE